MPNFRSDFALGLLLTALIATGSAHGAEQGDKIRSAVMDAVRIGPSLTSRPTHECILPLFEYTFTGTEPRGLYRVVAA